MARRIFCISICFLLVSFLYSSLCMRNEGLFLSLNLLCFSCVRFFFEHTFEIWQFSPLERESCQQYFLSSWNTHICVCVYIFFTKKKECGARSLCAYMIPFSQTEKNINKENKLYNIYMNKFILVKLQWIANVHFVTFCSFVVGVFLWSFATLRSTEENVSLPKMKREKEEIHAIINSPEEYDENNKKHSIFNLLVRSISLSRRRKWIR